MRFKIFFTALLVIGFSYPFFCKTIISIANFLLIAKKFL